MTLRVGALCAAFVVLSAHAALAAEPTPSTMSTTVPTSTPTTPSTTTPTTTPTNPTSPNKEATDLSPDKTLATPAEFAALTEGQRQLLRQLQTASDKLALRRFALVALTREVTIAQGRLDEARAVDSAARAKVNATVEQLQAVKDEIFRLAAAAYRNHAGSRALGALGSIDTANPGAVSRARIYARSDAALLGARVDALNALKRRLESEQRSADLARTQAEASAADLNARLADQTQALKEATVATAAAQAAAVRGLGSGASLIAQIIDPHLGADSITAALAIAQFGQGDPTSLDGILALPIPGASLSSPYGMRIDPIEGGVGFHAGLDFGADMRTPIHAAAAGVVVVAGDCGGYGNCVVIDHGTSLATVYAHQSLVISQVGDIVAAGQSIGLVGSTGISTGPHLHFEVRLHGVPIDPVPILAG